MVLPQLVQGGEDSTQDLKARCYGLRSDELPGGSAGTAPYDGKADRMGMMLSTARSSSVTAANVIISIFLGMMVPLAIS